MNDKRIIELPIAEGMKYCHFVPADKSIQDCEGYSNKECGECPVGKYLTRTEGIEILVEEPC